MELLVFLDKINKGEAVSFQESMATISEHYDYTPSEFTNGLGEDRVINAAGTNEGSCRIFAFARMHQLGREQTLTLFGDYYHKDVLGNPDGTDHKNIRNFMIYGWDGIQFSQEALYLKKS